MSLKRSAPGGNDNQSSKKLKSTPTSAETLLERTRSADDEAEITNANWVIPAATHNRDARDESDQVTQYAHSLYDQPWNRLRVTQEPFGFPRLRTPIFKGLTTAVLTPLNHDNQSSEAVCSLFEDIKRDTKRPSKGAAAHRPGPYVRAAFDQAFDSDDNNSAVVASRSNANPILALTEDFWVQV